MGLDGAVGIGLVVLGTFLLVRGADWFIDNLADAAPALGVSALALGVLLASLEPEEMLTAAIASFRGNPALAVGNVIGTNVVITTLALGLSALIAPLVIDPAVRRQALVATLVSALPVLLLVTGLVTRLEGILMLVVFGGYTVLLLRIKSSASEDKPIEQPIKRETWRLVVPILGGLVGMAVGGSLLVDGALKLAMNFGLSEGAVGASIVSLGTGAEMIALGVSAARARQTGILVGGIIGSFAYNLLVTLGLAAVIRPLPVDVALVRTALPIMVTAHLLLLILVWRGQISRVIGGFLVLCFVAYLLLVVIPTH